MIQNNYKYPSQQKPDMKEEFSGYRNRIKIFDKIWKMYVLKRYFGKYQLENSNILPFLGWNWMQK